MLLADPAPSDRQRVPAADRGAASPARVWRAAPRPKVRQRDGGGQGPACAEVGRLWRQRAAVSRDRVWARCITPLSGVLLHYLVAVLFSIFLFYTKLHLF